MTRAPQAKPFASDKRAANGKDSAVVPLARAIPQAPPTTAPAFDAIDERFIEFLVEKALKAWRTKTSKVNE